MTKHDITGSALSVHATHVERRVEVGLDIAAGNTAVIVGPNGAGKSTILGLIAGFLTPSSGGVRINDRDVTGLAVWQRKVALLAQRAVLFEHLSVLDNVAFAPRIAGLSRARSREEAYEWLEKVQALDWAHRRPDQLSGGQAQRIAIAQALAAQPQVLLLDEPFAAVDVQSAAELRALLHTLVQGQTCVMVTHDVADVATLADEVIVLEAGRVAQHTSSTELMDHPTTAFAARLVGLNKIGDKLFAPRNASLTTSAATNADYQGVVVGCISQGHQVHVLCRVEDALVEIDVDRHQAHHWVAGAEVGVVVHSAGREHAQQHATRVRGGHGNSS